MVAALQTNFWDTNYLAVDALVRESYPVHVIIKDESTGEVLSESERGLRLPTHYSDSKQLAKTEVASFMSREFGLSLFPTLYDFIGEVYSPQEERCVSYFQANITKKERAAIGGNWQDANESLPSLEKRITLH